MHAICALVTVRTCTMYVQFVYALFNAAMKLYLLIVSLLYSLQWTECGVSSPIVIVPGILGNQLDGKLTNALVSHSYCRTHTDGWENMWLSLSKLIYPEVFCLSDYLKLKHNPVTGEYSDNDGVEIQVPGFGGTSSIEYLDPSLKFFETTNYFHDMVQWFVDKGYTRGKDIVGAPYDWRYSPNTYLKRGYFDKLKNLIETVYNNNSQQRVVLLAHSMGSPTSLYFLTKIVDQAWKEKYIRVYVTMAGVWHGAGKAAKSFATGDNEDIPLDKDSWGRASQRTYPANAWLLPYPSDTWTPEDIIVVNEKRNYSAWDYKDLFTDLNYTRGWEMFNEIKNLTGQLPAPNVTMYCFYGNISESTPVQFVYAPGDFPNKEPTTIKGDGDGTVNIKSLMACSRWQGKQYYNVTLRQFPNVEHVHTIKNKDVIAAVDAIVYAKDERR